CDTKTNAVQAPRPYVGKNKRMIVLLLLTMAIPAGTAFFLMLFRHSLPGRAPRAVALSAAIVTFLVSRVLVPEPREPPVPEAAAAGETARPIQPRFEKTYHWFTYPAPTAAAEGEGFQFDFQFGLDGISLTLIVLTTVLT